MKRQNTKHATATWEFSTLENAPRAARRSVCMRSFHHTSRFDDWLQSDREHLVAKVLLSWHPAKQPNLRQH